MKKSLVAVHYLFVLIFVLASCTSALAQPEASQPQIDEKSTAEVEATDPTAEQRSGLTRGEEDGPRLQFDDPGHEGAGAKLIRHARQIKKSKQIIKSLEAFILHMEE